MIISYVVSEGEKQRKERANKTRFLLTWMYVYIQKTSLLLLQWLGFFFVESKMAKKYI